MPKIYQGIRVCEIAQITESQHKFSFFSLLPFIYDESSVTQILKCATNDDEKETRPPQPQEQHYPVLQAGSFMFP